MPQANARRGSAGFTLIELMIVVVVVGILAAIALPNYREQVVNSRRATAGACLVEVAQAMERWYTTNMTYVGAAPQCSQQNEMAGHYGAVAVGNLTARTYTLTVTPAGAQASADTKCGALTLTQAGVKGEGGSATNASDCF